MQGEDGKGFCSFSDAASQGRVSESPSDRVEEKVFGAQSQTAEPGSPAAEEGSWSKDLGGGVWRATTTLLTRSIRIFDFFLVFGHGDGCKLSPARSNLEALECTKTLVALDGPVLVRFTL